MATTTPFLAEAERQRDACAEFLRDLVHTPSLSACERDVVGLITERMEALGYDEVVLDPFGSVIGRIGPPNGSTRIVMDSHIDTVGVGARDEWSQDPFEPVLRDGVIYGRGACDDKGGTAAMVYGAALARQWLPPDTTLYVVGSVQEEDCDGLALEHVLNHVLPRPDVVVLGEATNGSVYRGNRGRIEVLVRTRGSSCHASAPERGHNPVYDLAPVIAEVEALNGRLGYDEFLGAGTLALTKIECETPSLNVVPGGATIYIDRRLTLGEDPDVALKEIASLPAVQRVGGTVELLTYERTSFTGMRLGMEKAYKTWAEPAGSRSVQAALAAVSSGLGRTQTETGAWVFSTNGVASMGKLGIPTVGFGPGDERYAHTVGDQCPVQDLVDSMAFYAAFPGEYTR